MIERSEFITRSRRSVGALVLVGAAALFGCSDRNIQGLDESDGVVYKGKIAVEKEVHEVKCFGPNENVVAGEGDSLSILLRRQNVGTPTIIGGIGTPEVPIEVYTQAVAEMNHLDDQHLITVGQSILLPTSCVAEPRQ